ncbi:DUF4389 domain-containing protein [Streptomyces fuscichromogenes]|uniref:DUF4389 domain-containing protein n=1 Tax=Streptomyces fuscichromogenes TaxID=1324013 RepID=A0A917XE39_9ACTN|nr:DUF4389 domain-containing protein [Streptomyces fuscichromogenes]GGN11396.1 hypothetical protein GCM10011578_037740 [Streptomyces fuscichromogenes]
MTQSWGPRPPLTADGAEWRPALDIPAPGPQRRWTVLLRWPLLIPQYVVLCLLGIAAFFTTVAGWFAALVLGRLPDGIASFLGKYLAYETRIAAASMLLVDRYPPFALTAPDHPVRIELRPTALNRFAVLFRLILMIPAAIIANLATTGWFVISWIFWIIALVRGRLPDPVFGATAAVARYRMRFGAYTSMLSPVYPKDLLGDRPDTAKEAGQEAASGTRPLVLDTAAKFLVWAFLVLGLITQIGSRSTGGHDENGLANTPQVVHLARRS